MSAAAPDPGVSVLRVLGDGDAWARLRLRSDLRAALDDRAPLIVDLSAATSLDAHAAALLVDSIAICEAAERTCVLLVPENSPERVRGRFERRGLTSLLPIVRDWDEALRRAQAAQPDEPGCTSPVS